MIIRNCLKLLRELSELEKDITVLENIIQTRNSDTDFEALLQGYINAKLGESEK